ncbi:MAG TPA: DinB family protein [Acidimicrobiales bacterium]
MDVDGYLVELFGRLPGLVHAAVEDLDEAKLAEAPADGANTIAWLVWHLTRIEDHHLSEAAGTPQRYIEDGWHERFGRGADPQDHGYGHSPADVASVRATADDLAGYHDAVHARTIDFLSGLTPGDLDRIVDESWDPPVTLGVRLASVASDCLQHVGQAAYLRGLIT